MKLRNVVVVVVVLAALGTWWATRQYGTAEGSLPPLHTETVDRGDVSQRVVAHGSLQPVERVEVGSQVSGIVEAVMVDFNSRVTRGQPIAQIDPSTFEAALNSAEAELESAEAGLELARHHWERVQELREMQFVPPSDVDEARVSMRQAEAQVRVRRHALDAARRELERSTITAPSDGIVISRTVDVGQTVAASLSAPILFELAADLTRMHIHASVSEADIGMVEEGQLVRFIVDSHRDRQFSGEVIQVRNAPMMEDNVVHYETIIAVSNEEGLLRPGMTAEVSIITEEVTDVTRVRNTALRARIPDDIRPPDPDGAADADAVVYRLENGELQATTVRVGLSDGTYSEVLDGLAEGDVLAVGLSLMTQDEGNRRSIFGGEQAQY